MRASAKDVPPGFRERAERLVTLARTRTRALVLTHDNPDPDSIAAALALAQIFREKAGLHTTIGYGGLIGRAENTALVSVLALPLVPLSRVVFAEHDLLCLVDTQPEMGNHSLPATHFPDVVIDHHPERPESSHAAHADVGGDFGATSTIAALYLRALGLTPTRQVATALFYGIKADTRNLARETEAEDVAAYHWLFPFVDQEALAAIEHPRLPADYFRLFHRALERARVYDDAIIADLGPIYTPDMVAEVAERHLALQGMRWSLALARFDGHLFVSLRARDVGANAGEMIRDVVETRGGSAGGHGQMAGGRLPLTALGEAQVQPRIDELVAAFCARFGVSTVGVPLLELPTAP